MSTLAKLIQHSLDFDSGLLSTRRSNHRYVLTPTPETFFRALAALSKGLPRHSVELLLERYGNKTDQDGRAYVAEFKPGIRCPDVDDVDKRSRYPVISDERTGGLEILVTRKECNTCAHYKAARKPYCQLAQERNRGRTARMANKAIEDARAIVEERVPTCKEHAQ